MSFQEQERAMFDLIFDSVLREEFCTDQVASLENYALSEAEKADFNTIRLDGLLLDAKMRVYLLLSHWSKSFPVSFSIISSLEHGIDTLKHLVDAQVMRSSPAERPVTYGARLKQWLDVYAMESEAELARIHAILGAESGMATSKAALKQSIINGEQQPPLQNDIPTNWSKKAVRFVPYVYAVMIPQPYAQLKESLCPCIDAEFWRQLSSKPLSRSQVSQVLQHEDPRLLVTKANVSHISACEPTIEHQTIELSEGFAPLFQHINGTFSVDDILIQLQQAGADEVLLQKVKSGFNELLEQGMLELS